MFHQYGMDIIEGLKTKELKLDTTVESMNFGNKLNCKFFIMSTEFDKNISDRRYDCTDHKNGNDFFMSLVKRPKIAFKKSQIQF